MNALTSVVESGRPAPRTPLPRARRARASTRCARDPRGLHVVPAALALALVASPAAGQTLNPDLIRAQCEMVHQIEDQSILFGTVVDERSGMSIPGGTVFLRWVTTSGIADTVVHSASAETASGAYIFCDVPQDTRLEAWASALGETTARKTFYFEGGESTRHDLQIRLRLIFGALSGRVTDADTGSPVAEATLSIEGAGVSTLTDSNGRFLFGEVPIGSHELEIAHLAYGRPTLSITVQAGQSTHVEVTLDPRAIALEPLSVRISTRVRWLETTGFYYRQASNLGQFVTPEDLRRRPYARFSEVLRDVPGLEVRTICTPRCSHRIRMATATQGGCIPTFYVDGRRILVRPAPTVSRNEPRGLIDLDAVTSGSDLAAVEVYRSIAETPAEFYGRCGSIVVWTKRGGG